MRRDRPVTLVKRAYRLVGQSVDGSGPQASPRPRKYDRGIVSTARTLAWEEANSHVPDLFGLGITAWEWEHYRAADRGLERVLSSRQAPREDAGTTYTDIDRHATVDLVARELFTSDIEAVYKAERGRGIQLEQTAHSYLSIPEWAPDVEEEIRWKPEPSDLARRAGNEITDESYGQAYYKAHVFAGTRAHKNRPRAGTLAPLDRPGEGKETAFVNKNEPRECK